MTGNELCVGNDYEMIGGKFPGLQVRYVGPRTGGGAEYEFTAIENYASGWVKVGKGEPFPLFKDEIYFLHFVSIWKKRCECGSESVGHPGHSSWCPLDERPEKFLKGIRT